MATVDEVTIQVQVQDRAAGGGLPASPLSPTPLPHPTTPCGTSLCTVETQTDITVSPFSNFLTFSATTCAELLSSLTPEQLDFEINFNNDILNRNLDFKSTRNSAKISKTEALNKVISENLAHEFKEIFYECESFSFLTQSLSKAIAEARKFLEEFKRPSSTEVEDEEAEVFHDAVSEVAVPHISEFDLPEPVRFLDFNVGSDITVESIAESFDFKSVGNRKVAHVGPASYRYGGVFHPASEYPSCSALDTIIERIQNKIGIDNFNKQTWNCMATLYNNAKASIPMHSDSQQQVPGSEIYTVSLGSTRTLKFQNILGPVGVEKNFDLEHGSVHCMSTESQTAWQHGIPPSTDTNCGPRLSLTFRKLQTETNTEIPPIRRPDATLDGPSPVATDNSTTHRKKRVLFLSDSLHRSFPTHFLNSEDTVCIKKTLPNFCLSNLDKFEGEFSYTDYVFLSCGVNDLSRYGKNSRTLFNYFSSLIKVYRQKFPNTLFIFNSLLLTSFGWLNDEVMKLNYDIFHLSLENKGNLWFFDSHHIAETLYNRGVNIIEKNSRRANGVHITYDATSEIRAVIQRCIQELSSGNKGVVGKIWPLREQFRRIAAHIH